MSEEVAPLSPPSSPSPLMSHAVHELSLLGDQSDLQQAAIDDDILSLVSRFGDQHHSGSTAAYVLSILDKLLRFQPLTPLTGDESEWIEVAPSIYQNRRCGTVFKKPDGAYDINGVVFRYPNGMSYTNADSRVPIIFPYTPTVKYVDRPSSTASTVTDVPYTRMSLSGRLIMLKASTVPYDGIDSNRTSKSTASMDDPYRFSKMNRSHRDTYGFKSSTHPYVIYMESIPSEPSKVHVTFIRKKPIGVPDGVLGPTDIQRDEPHPHRVMSTIYHVIKRHIDDNPNVTVISFSSPSSDESRLRLYHRMASTLSPSKRYGIKNEDGAVKFTVPVRDDMQSTAARDVNETRMALRRLIEHPNTGHGEREAAREALRRLSGNGHHDEEFETPSARRRADGGPEAENDTGVMTTATWRHPTTGVRGRTIWNSVSRLVHNQRNPGEGWVDWGMYNSPSDAENMMKYDGYEKDHPLASDSKNHLDTKPLETWSGSNGRLHYLHKVSDLWRPYYTTARRRYDGSWTQPTVHSYLSDAKKFLRERGLRPMSATR